MACDTLNTDSDRGVPERCKPGLKVGLTPKGRGVIMVGPVSASIVSGIEVDGGSDHT